MLRHRFYTLLLTGFFYFMLIEYAYFSKSPIFYYRGDESLSLLEEHKEKFLAAHREYESTMLLNYDNSLREYKILLDSFKNSLWCVGCGARLKWIEGYNFMGCPNYRIKGRHGLPDYIPSSPYKAIDTNWLSKIIMHKGFRGRIKASALYHFYKKNGLPDLREKYHSQSSLNKLESLVKTKRVSQEQEQLFKLLIEESGRKVAYQQCINYKLIAQKEKFCIPDFIAGNSINVWVIDAKLDRANDEKMDKYVSLVKFIMNKAGDNRPVIGAHMMFSSAVGVQETNTKYDLLIVEDHCIENNPL